MTSNNNENLIINKSTLIDIGNAIREKTGETGLIKVSEMAEKILNINGINLGTPDRLIFTINDVSNPSYYNVRALNTSIIGDIVIPEYYPYNNVYYPVQVITESAFNGCRSISSVVIPDTVISLGSYAFVDCINLSSIDIGSGITSLPTDCFARCNNLRYVTFGKNLTHITNGAFNNTPEKTLYYKDSIDEYVQSVPDISFFVNPKILYTMENGIYKLADNISILNSITINYCAFKGLTCVVNVIIGDSVLNINTGAFFHCTNLEDIILGQNVKNIGESALNGCTSLTGITIPSNVTILGNYLFVDSSNLRNITVENTTPPTAGTDFLVNTSIANIYVPAESVEIYKTANNWNKYANIISAI